MSTEQQRQRVSALMDGEAGRFEAHAAVNDLTRSPDLAERWERWHLIGRALRGEPCGLAARAISERVRAQAASADAGARQVRVQSPAWLRRPLVGALAAGVAVLGLAVVLTGPFQPKEAPAPQFVTASHAAPRWQQPDPAVRARLDRLLVNHQEQSPGIGRSGVAAYAAVIGYERLR